MNERMLIQEGYWSDDELLVFILSYPEKWAEIRDGIDWEAREVFLRLKKRKRDKR